jgi:hypothetical protein
MQPYRSPAPGHFKVSFGDDRGRVLLVVVALLAITLSLASIVASLWSGHGHVALVFVSLGGLLALLRRRSGSIEYIREEQELRVTSRTALASQRDRVAAREVTGLTIVRATGSSELELRLLLTGERSLVLLRSPGARNLETARAAVSAFLLEHGLLPREPAEATKVRVEGASDAGDEDVEDSEARHERRERS